MIPAPQAAALGRRRQCGAWSSSTHPARVSVGARCPMHGSYVSSTVPFQMLYSPEILVCEPPRKCRLPSLPFRCPFAACRCALLDVAARRCVPTRPPAVRRTQADMAKLLVDHGADANARCAGGLTPLHHAACGSYGGSVGTTLAFVWLRCCGTHQSPSVQPTVFFRQCPPWDSRRRPRLPPHP